MTKQINLKNQGRLEKTSNEFSNALRLLEIQEHLNSVLLYIVSEINQQ